MFGVEIDLEQNEQLVKGKTTNLMTQKIGTRRVETKKKTWVYVK